MIQREKRKKVVQKEYGILMFEECISLIINTNKSLCVGNEKRKNGKPMHGVCFLQIYSSRFINCNQVVFLSHRIGTCVSTPQI